MTDIKTVVIEGYLTEDILYSVLVEVFGESNVTREYPLIISNKRLRIDFKVDIKESYFFVEFNGDTHYKKVAVQNRDELVEEWCIENGILLVSIPYFIQLKNDSLPVFFPEDIIESYFKYITIVCDFPHGFISEKCVLPADFNTRGWNRFLREYRYPINKLDNWSISKDIFKSLYDRLDTAAEKDILGENIGDQMMSPETFFELYPT